METEELIRKNEQLTQRVEALEKEIASLKTDKEWWMKAELDRNSECEALKSAIKTISKYIN